MIILRRIDHLDCALKTHITTLIITINENECLTQPPCLAFLIFDRILSTFMNLRCLKMQLSHEWYLHSVERVIISQRPPTLNSSTLQELYVSVGCATDLLYILDGRFSQLRKFHVHVGQFINFSTKIIRKVE